MGVTIQTGRKIGEILDGIEEESMRILAWRLHCLEQEGCDVINALLIGRSGCDLHKARRMLRNGCPPELAAKILS